MFTKMVQEGQQPKSAKIAIPAAVKVKIEGDKIIVEGQKGKVERTYPVKNIEIKVSGSSIEINVRGKTAHHRALEGTFRAHIKNMLRGVVEPFIYRLKVAYVHFPMSAKIQGSELIVTNFLGAKQNQIVKIPNNVAVKVENEIITVSSPDIELAGKTVTLIEQSTRVSKRDRRVFLDGIYLIEKYGKPITA
ncbi:MAG: 50S ribosomal protein L6 [DPANN group archaeon]|nr:50S ribosomal protein L6 [DPANN group archaeon]